MDIQVVVELPYITQLCHQYNGDAKLPLPLYPPPTLNPNK